MVNWYISYPAVFLYTVVEARIQKFKKKMLELLYYWAFSPSKLMFTKHFS